MVVKIIGLIIGILVLGAGIYYLVREKSDAESKKIYTVVSILGAVIAAVCAVLLALFAADEVYSSAHPNTGAGITSIESGAPEAGPEEESPLAAALEAEVSLS